ncbi:MAG TPA: hypothetical protein VGI40_26150 [Pirellulaceae bacterium]|jgi:phage anti-repressor protein
MDKSNAQLALEFFREQATHCKTAQELHNAFFGNGAKLSQLFPTRTERDAFWQTPEFAEIRRIGEEFDELHDRPYETAVS